MGVLRTSLVLAIMGGVLAVTGSRNEPLTLGPRDGDGGTVSPQAIYSPQSKEHYLSTEQLDFLRPGVHVSIVGVTSVAAGQKPVVELLFTDDLGAPLDRTGIATPGTIDAEFVLGQWDASNYEYVNLTTVAFGPTTIFPLHDVGGTWQDIAVGHSKYTFAKALPANFDATKTVTLGIYTGRNTKDIVGKDYVAPAAFKDFRPDGGAAATVFAAINTASCNNCHDPISMHEQFGPAIQDVKLCVMCHTSQMPITQTGESLNFKILVHKIHRGKSLPSVQAGKPYVVSPGADFSTVGLPQDIRNCSTCHTPSAADSANWYTRPARAACGSCHDDLNFATGANHPAGPYNDDTACAACHVPQGDREYDASILGAHTVPYRSSQLKGLKAKIVSVTNTAPGQKPTVVFAITNGDGSAVNPSQLGNVFLVVAGPTTDYTTVPFSFFESAKAASFDGSNATYTLTNAIPASATGTWAVALTALRTVTLNPAPIKGPATVGEAATNPVVYVAVTDSQPVPRRTVVARDNCNKCHDQLALHGRNFLSTELCVLCHNPQGDDSSQRPADKNPPESIAFKRFIHRIHTGENLTQNFTIYGFQHSVNNYNEVRYPGDRRDCLQCHTSSTTYDLPLPTGTVPVVTQRDFFSPQGPATAGCLGCHDNIEAVSHANLNTVTAPFFGEACATCHGADKDWDVAKVHAR